MNNQATDRRQSEIPRDIRGFLRFTAKEIIRKKRWMLIPFWLVLAVVGVILVLSGNAHLLPAIYLAI